MTKNENVRFLEKAVVYIESLKDGMLKEELYDETPKFAYRIEQAIDKAYNFLDEGDEKMEILDKTSDIMRRENRIKKPLIKRRGENI